VDVFLAFTMIKSGKTAHIFFSVRRRNSLARAFNRSALHNEKLQR
jgi:hypothetical protein